MLDSISNLISNSDSNSVSNSVSNRVLNSYSNSISRSVSFSFKLRFKFKLVISNETNGLTVTRRKIEKLQMSSTQATSYLVWRVPLSLLFRDS